MEGPSLYIAAEQLAIFKGKKVRVVSGNTKIGKEIFLEKKIKDIFPWGKHLIFQFDVIALRIHFLLFGTFEATSKGKSLTGEYKKSRKERLGLIFTNGNIKLFNCSIKIYETKNIKDSYDFTVDIMSPFWDGEKALANLQKYPDEEIADVLLDQNIFAGVGNIIKNEVLFICRINPRTFIKLIPDKKIKQLIFVAREFSYQFYKWRKEFILRKRLKIYQKSFCPYCLRKLYKEKTGKRNRWSYYCFYCQPYKS